MCSPRGGSAGAFSRPRARKCWSEERTKLYNKPRTRCPPRSLGPNETTGHIQCYLLFAGCELGLGVSSGLGHSWNAGTQQPPHRRCVCVAAEEAACRVRPVRFVRAATGRDERHEERTSCEVRGVVVLLLPPLPAFALSARLSPDARLVSLSLSQGAPPAFPIISHTWVGRFLGRAARTVAKISLSSASPSPSFTHPFSLFLPASRAPQRRYERAARTATHPHGQWPCFPRARARPRSLARSGGLG